jgi:Flp pilus assembly protein TadB
MPESNGQDQMMRDRPIGEVASDLTRDVSLLVRQEIQLAKSEVAEKARIAKPGLGMIGAGGLVALMAAGAATAFAILVLATFLADWLAALIVALAFGIVAYVLAMQGKARIQQAGSPVPEQTIETVKEDLEWAKTRATSARK